MTKEVKTKLVTLIPNPAYQYWLLGVTVVIAIALRMYKLGEWSFWGDEMFTLRDSENVFNLALTSRSMSRLATHIILNLLGTSEWSARLFPALIGAISIPALYFPVKKIFGPGPALIAGVLLTISPWHLYWSQNARFYVPLLLFYTLALLTFYLAIEEDHLGYLLLSMFLLGLAALEHLTALIFGPIAVCYLVLVQILPFDKPAGLRPRNICIFLVPGLVAGLLLVLPVLRDLTRWLGYFEQVNNSPFWILAGVVYYVGLPLICIGALGAVYLLTKKNRAALLLSLGAVVPLLVIMAIALIQYTANRYVFISLTSWIILASLGMKELFSQTQGHGKILAFGVLSILLLTPFSENVLYYKYQNGNRDNWRDAFALVREQKGAHDLVVVPHTLLADYYLQDESIGMGRVHLSNIEKGKNKVWFVEDMTVEKKYPQVHNWLGQNAQLVANLDIHVRARNFKMRVYLYDPNQLSRNSVSLSGF